MSEALVERLRSASQDKGLSIGDAWNLLEEASEKIAAWRFTREERANISHALMHLEANKITASQHRGWYCGNRAQFVERHRRAIEFMQGLRERCEE